MPLKRKAHRKSRGGCQECKRRRIKCDEERPQCGHCIRHEAQCIYLDSTPGRAPSSNPSASARGSPTTPGDHTVARSTLSPSDIPYVFVDDGITIPTGSYFNLRDMALMHHWTLLTSLSIVKSPTLDHFWQTVYPEIAFQHAYVMHSILSITALHSIFLSPPNRRTHLCIATHHHTLALRGFREGIDSMGPDNSEALFASATLIFFYAFLTFGNICIARGEDPGAAAPTSQILGADWIPLVRGMRAVLAPLREYIGNGPLSSLLSMGNFFELDPDKQPGPNDDRFIALRETWVSDSHATVYEEALKMLRVANAFMAQFEDVPEDQMPDVGYNRQWSGPFAWLFVCSHEYFTLQQQRQPVAMVLFAYFGVLVAKLDQRGLWWAQGCGKSIVSAVQDVLGPFWRQWLSWPEQMVGLQ